MVNSQSNFEKHLTLLENVPNVPRGLRDALIDVCDTAHACKLWFDSEGVPATDLGIAALARLVLQRQRENEGAPAADETQLSCSDSDGGVQWHFEVDRPDLTPEKAMVIAVVKGADAIAGALNQVAVALDRVADRE